jgi:hypothetical protein
MKRVISVCVAMLAASLAAAKPVDTVVNSRAIINFKIASTQSEFGALKFVGGLELTSGNADFGAISAFRFVDNGNTLLSVSDNGFWISGKISRDAQGKPASFDTSIIAQMNDAGGNAVEKKWLTDAEGLLVDGDKVSVSFERDHRISTGLLDPITFKFTSFDEPLPVPGKEIRSNRGFETMAKSPVDSALGGARVAITEKSLNSARNIYAGIMDGLGKGVFFIARQGDYDITDGDFLPNGDLLLLERKFSMATGVAMRIRRVYGANIQKGATVDGEVVLEADMAYQIDNMEGLDVWQRSDGATMISLMSDDNHSILQRNLYLEFELAQ